MAYCLRSLVEILEQIMYPDQHYKNWVLDHAKIPQIQSLLENATFLRDFFDTTSPLILPRIESLEDQIMEAAGKAEDTLESHITDHILSKQEGQKSFTISPPDLDDVLKVFEVAKKELIKVKATGQQWSGSNVSPPVSSTRYPDSKNALVGVEEDLKKLRSRIIGRAAELDIIPIVGMGGSGKTALAQILYDEHSSRNAHFDCCAWVTVSQTYDPNLILRTLVDLVGKAPEEENVDLIVALHKSLYRRRYLIVLDDVWSCNAWDEFQRAFPQDDNRSRIILTTRDNSVANYINLNSHQIHVLSKDDSWELLSGKVFGEQSCPNELEDIGKRIALNCGGLPLALQVIGGLLSQSEKSVHLWENVAYNISSLIAETDDHFCGIFYWSFVNLPHYLKPCFLYMGSFPEDHVIRHSTIMQLWVSEGFLYPIPNKSLEEAVEIHLNSLVDRNLIFVRKSKAKTYGIHDLLRELCLRKAQEKKFIYFKDSQTDILQEDMLSLRRVNVHLSDEEKKDEFGSLKLTSLARSFRLTGGRQESNRFVHRLCYESSLLRVLQAYPSTIFEFHKEFLQLVNLRYLSLWIKEGVVPRSISILQNLRTLIVRSLESIMILEDLPQLRTLWFRNLEQRSYERSFRVHDNMQILGYIPLETLTRLLGKLPKMRILKINGEHSNDNIDFSCFQKLESLKFTNGYKPDGFYFPSKTIFPNTIKKLAMKGYNLTQTIVDTIGNLPNLQILEFDSVIFENFIWESSEDGFRQLQYLEFRNSFLENISTTAFHFPVLRHLIFHSCRKLTEISTDIGEIVTLEIIEVDECKTCVFQWARRIQEEQLQFGNTLLQLRLGCALEEKEGKKRKSKHG